MGQLALGLRSLLIRLAIFLVMAALLAWALGGTLLPRAETHDYERHRWQGSTWHWRQSIGGRVPGGMAWQFMTLDENGKSIPIDGRIWTGGAGPILTSDAMYYAGRRADGTWVIESMDGEAGTSTVVRQVPDRLAMEMQLARLAAGLELLDVEAILRQRDEVLAGSAQP